MVTRCVIGVSGKAEAGAGRYRNHLRGNVVTASAGKTEAIYSERRGSSDLMLTLVGAKAMEYWNEDAFCSMLHKPMQPDPGIAPALNPLEELRNLPAGRLIFRLPSASSPAMCCLMSLTAWS